MYLLKCRYTRARIPALINHELPVNTRRYVARHLDECPNCRADYDRQKQLQQQLQREMPRMGQPDKLALNRIQSKVLAELISQPVAPVRTTSHRPLFMYGLVMAMVAVSVLLPLAAAGTTVKAALPDYPAPRDGVDISTPSVVAVLTESTRVAAAFAVQTAPGETDTPSVLDNTPATPEPVASNHDF